jgi:predicted transcriptional regulator
MQTMSIRLTDEVYEKLKKEAAQRNMSMNGLVNYILYDFFDAPTVEIPSTTDIFQPDFIKKSVN